VGAWVTADAPVAYQRDEHRAAVSAPAQAARGHSSPPSESRIVAPPHARTTAEAGPTLNGLSRAASHATELTPSEELASLVRTKTRASRTCFEANPLVRSAKVTLEVTVEHGRATSISPDGGDPRIVECIESQVRRWSFKERKDARSFTIPFYYARQ
jgi:hypothetical protein